MPIDRKPVFDAKNPYTPLPMTAGKPIAIDTVLKAGDEIAWQSQSQGYWSIKCGHVVAVLENNHDSIGDHLGHLDVPASRIKAANRGPHPRVLVAVPRERRKPLRPGQEPTLDYYAPLVTMLVRDGRLLKRAK